MGKYTSFGLWCAANIVMFLIILAKNDALNEGTFTTIIHNLRGLHRDTIQYIFEPTGRPVQYTSKLNYLPRMAVRPYIMPSCSQMRPQETSVATGEETMKYNGDGHKGTNVPQDHTAINWTRTTGPIPLEKIKSNSSYENHNDNKPSTKKLLQLCKSYQEKKMSFDREMENFQRQLDENIADIAAIKRAAEEKRKLIYKNLLLSNVELIKEVKNTVIQETLSIESNKKVSGNRRKESQQSDIKDNKVKPDIDKIKMKDFEEKQTNKIQSIQNKPKNKRLSEEKQVQSPFSTNNKTEINEINTKEMKTNDTQSKHHKLKSRKSSDEHQPLSSTKLDSTKNKLEVDTINIKGKETNEIKSKSNESKSKRQFEDKPKSETQSEEKSKPQVPLSPELNFNKNKTKVNTINTKEKEIEDIKRGHNESKSQRQSEGKQPQEPFSTEMYSANNKSIGNSNKIKELATNDIRSNQNEPKSKRQTEEKLKLRVPFNIELNSINYKSGVNSIDPLPKKPETRKPSKESEPKADEPSKLTSDSKDQITENDKSNNLSKDKKELIKTIKLEEKDNIQAKIQPNVPVKYKEIGKSRIHLQQLDIEIKQDDDELDSKRTKEVKNKPDILAYRKRESSDTRSGSDKEYNKSNKKTHSDIPVECKESSKIKPPNNIIIHETNKLETVKNKEKNNTDILRCRERDNSDNTPGSYKEKNKNKASIQSHVRESNRDVGKIKPPANETIQETKATKENKEGRNDNNDILKSRKKYSSDDTSGIDREDSKNKELKLKKSTLLGFFEDSSNEAIKPDLEKLHDVRTNSELLK